jgi:hypothetical protein
MAERAVTLVRNRDGLLPLAAPDRACFLALAESRDSNEGQTFPRKCGRGWRMRR